MNFYLHPRKGNGRLPQSLILWITLLLLPLTAVAGEDGYSKAARAALNEQQKQQLLRISGTVIDETGEPVIGAAVLEKGTSNGAVTNEDGAFTLSVKPNATLVISCLGYVTQEAEARAQMQIVLKENVEALEEVVVIGYGVQKKSNVTGAISSLKADDLKNMPVSDAAAALQGKVAGVQVVTNSGSPGATPTIRVRGYSSNGSSDPLYIVDGLKVSDISYLEPNSIKNMEILKDAASAAIYGAEAGNGVILITTKTGDRGTARIGFDAQWVYSSLAKKVDVMNAEEYRQFYTEGAGDGFTSLYDQYHIAGTDTDWQDVMYETGVMQKFNVSAEAGNENGAFFVALGYMNNDGMLKMDKDYYRRFTGQINASYNLRKWLEVGTNNTITAAKRSSMSENNFQYGMLKDILIADPLTPVYYTDANMPERIRTDIANGLHPAVDANGNYLGYSWTQIGTQANPNPLASVINSNAAFRTYYVNGMTYANLKPFKNFVFTTRLGYTLGALTDNEYTPIRLTSFFGDADNPLTLNSNQYANLYYQWENFFNYTIETKDAGEFAVMGGMSYSDSETVTTATQTDELINTEPNFIYMDYSANGATDFVRGNIANRRKIAYYGRLSWSYLNRYNLQTNFRADSYDAAYLDLNHNWGYFPSVSIGWTFSEEDFIKGDNDSKGFTFGKLRASYGINGSISNLGNYMYAATLKTGQFDPSTNTANMTYYLNGQLYQGTYPSSVLANPKLRWERSRQWDIGLDLRFLNNRLSATIDYYDKLTDGLLVQSIAPLTTGASTVYQNLGKVANSGLELELEWNDRVGDLRYGIKGNIATVNNKVKEYRGEGVRIEGSGLLATDGKLTFFEEGYPLWYIRGYQIDHIDEATGEAVYKDFDGVEGITDADRTELGKGIPDFTYGMTLTAAYKNFDFSIYGAGASGNSLIYALMSTSPDSRANRPKFMYENRWTASNKQASLPSATYQINDPRLYNSDALVFDASFFKIKQIQLGYNMPKKWLTPVGMTSLRAFVSFDNFFTFTDYPGSDPEINSLSEYSSGMAIDYGGYPLSKSVSFGLNVSF